MSKITIRGDEVIDRKEAQTLGYWLPDGSWEPLPIINNYFIEENIEPPKTKNLLLIKMQSVGFSKWLKARYAYLYPAKHIHKRKK